MTEHQARHVLAITPTARRQLTEHPPEAAATAAYEFIVGPLLDTPYRVGKQLRPRWMIVTAHAAAPTASSTESTTTAELAVVDGAHRRDAYRP